MKINQEEKIKLIKSLGYIHNELVVFASRFLDAKFKLEENNYNDYLLAQQLVFTFDDLKFLFTHDVADLKKFLDEKKFDKF